MFVILIRVPKGSKFSIHLASIPNGENVRFRTAIFIGLMHTCSVWFEMAQKNLSYKSYDLSIYDHVNIAFTLTHNMTNFNYLPDTHYIILEFAIMQCKINN